VLTDSKQKKMGVMPISSILPNPQAARSVRTRVAHTARVRDNTQHPHHRQKTLLKQFILSNL
jgi:hypothetical protein